MPPSLALLVFDAAVNCGVGRAARWLQGVLGVAQDGVLGDITLAALARRIERESRGNRPGITDPEGRPWPGQIPEASAAFSERGETSQICAESRPRSPPRR